MPDPEIRVLRITSPFSLYELILLSREYGELLDHEEVEEGYSRAPAPKAWKWPPKFTAGFGNVMREMHEQLSAPENVLAVMAVLIRQAIKDVANLTDAEVTDAKAVAFHFEKIEDNEWQCGFGIDNNIEVGDKVRLQEIIRETTNACIGKENNELL